MVLHLFLRQKKNSEFGRAVPVTVLAFFFFFFLCVCIIFIKKWQKIVSISFQNKDGIAKENASFCLHNFWIKAEFISTG